MSGVTVRWRVVEWGPEELIAVSIAGLVGGTGFGIVLAASGQLESVGALLRAPGLVVGLPLALIAGVIGAFGYRILGTVDPLAEDVDDPITGTTLGACYGLVAWAVGVALLVPLWLGLFGVTLSVPYVHWRSLVGLLVYGALVGSTYPLVGRRVRS